MIVPKGNDRSWPRWKWQYFHRLGRCIDRAEREHGHLQQVWEDMIVYGQGFFTPDQQQKDADRVAQLMAGLKPTTGIEDQPSKESL